MRTILLTILVAMTLLAVPAVLAERGEDGRAKADAARAEHANDDANETASEHRANQTERAESRAASAADRTVALASFHENFTALRASWQESTTSAREACHSTTLDRANATKEQRSDLAHCIRDGYREWRALHADDLKTLREQIHRLFGSWGRAQHN